MVAQWSQTFKGYIICYIFINKNAKKTAYIYKLITSLTKMPSDFLICTCLSCYSIELGIYPRCGRLDVQIPAAMMFIQMLTFSLSNAQQLQAWKSTFSYKMVVFNAVHFLLKKLLTQDIRWVKDFWSIIFLLGSICIHF